MSEEIHRLSHWHIYTLCVSTHFVCTLFYLVGITRRQKITAENFCCTYHSKQSNLFSYTCNPEVSQMKVPYDQTNLENDMNFYEHVLVNAYHFSIQNHK